MLRGVPEGASVLLTGGAHRATLAAARSLSRRNISVVVLGFGLGRMVSSSRHVDRYFTAPDPVEEPESYVESILGVVRRTGVRIVVPTDDPAMLACVRQREAIEAEVTLAAPPSSALLNVRDKRANLETARRIGIPCPVQFELEHLDQVPELIDYLGFPLVLKNPGPAVEGERPRFGFRWLVARDEAELRDFLSRHCSAGAYPLIQQLVTGAVTNVCCFAVAGEVVAAHQYVRIRGLQGASVFHEVTATSPDLARYSQQMLGELKWDGPAQVGFFVRRSDGDVRYMETNGRFWGSIEGSVRAGWDFPAWTYEYFANGERPGPVLPKIGSRTCWHCGDLQALIAYLAGGASPTGSPRGKLRAVLDYFSSFTPTVHPDTFRLSDPLPAVVEHWELGTRAFHRRARPPLAHDRRGA